MYGTELSIYRRQVREERKGWHLGPSRQGGYYDVAEAMSLTGAHATGGRNGWITNVLVARAWLQMGVPLEEVSAAYLVAPEDLRTLQLSDLVISDANRAEIEAEVLATVPETPEPSRFVPAIHSSHGLTLDNNAGKPQPVGVSPLGGLHFKGAS